MALKKKNSTILNVLGKNDYSKVIDKKIIQKKDPLGGTTWPKDL